jgi:MoaA/NifB/PqqE/SkfB family radical SAM enzyme
VHKDLTTQQAKYWLRFFYARGLRQVDLTGGEPTIRKDIIELVSYARSVGYATVSVITNGLRMADPVFTSAMVAAGLNDVLFSVHGPDARIHDSLTRVTGSFEKLMRAIDLVRSHGVALRTNTVVNGVSCSHLDAIARLLFEKKVSKVNFILFNPIVEAQGSDADMNVSYAQAARSLMPMIDAYHAVFQRIAVRYMPFCVMPGYERYITNTAQIQYDPDEWDYYWRTLFRNGRIAQIGSLGLGMLLYPCKRRFAHLDWDHIRHEALKWTLAWKNKVKGPMCRKCRFSCICDGLWRDYARKAGFGELRAISGDKIEEPAQFLKF